MTANLLKAHQIKDDALLKNNAAKSKLLKQQFDGLNADVQNIKIDEKNAKSVKNSSKKRF